MKPIGKPVHRLILFLMLLLYPFLSGAQIYDNTEDDERVPEGRFENYQIFKNKKSNTFFITNAKEKMLVDNLNYCRPLNEDYLQVLNKKNELVYLNRKLKAVKNPMVGFTVCGTVNNYSLKLLKEGTNYLVKTTINRYFTEGANTTEITASIPDDNYDEVYFVNKKQEIKYDDNYPYPDYLLFKKGEKYGLIYKEVISVNDTVTLAGIYVKVMKGGLYGYFHLSAVLKYRRLDDYIFNLAYFELENGKSGFVDVEGNEYYKK